MGKYLDIVREARKREQERAEPEPDKIYRAAPPSLESPNARRLLDADWKPKVSFGGKVIWERPDNGFYCSEESALHFLKNKSMKGD